MPTRKARKRLTFQSGFSMVEMLLAAFILSIGIMGLTALQVMSLRASRGGQNLGMAVQLAEQVMDQVELEGRLTYLNTTFTQYKASGTLTGISYINTTRVDQYFNIDPTTGQVVKLPSATGALFHVWMTQPTIVAGTNLADVTVTVEFSDVISASGTAIPRTATITRRILHG